MAPSGRGLRPQAVEENACLSVKAFLGGNKLPAKLQFEEWLNSYEFIY